MSSADSNLFTVRIVAPSSGPAPLWITSLPVNSGWQRIAAGPLDAGRYTPYPNTLPPWARGNRIIDVRTLPTIQSVGVGNYAPGLDQIETMIRSWNGAAMDYDRKEMYFPANGGGGSYAGNEVYGLELWRDVPAWRLMSDRTPDAYMNTSAVAGTWSPTDIPTTHMDGPSGQLGDGRPRAFHSSGNICFANGRIWNIMQSAVTPNLNTQGLWSWDRDWLAQQPGEYAPWVNGNILPWRIHGIIGISGSGPGYAFAPCAHDPIANRLWGYADKKAWAVSTTTGGTVFPPFSHSQAALIGNGQTRGGWAVYVPGPNGDITQRKIIVGTVRRYGQQCLVHYLHTNTFAMENTSPLMQWDPDNFWTNWENPGVDNGGLAIPPGGSQYDLYLRDAQPYLYAEFSYGMGAVYSEVNDKVYLGVVPARFGGTVGGQVRVLDPRTMQITELANTGIRPVPMQMQPLSTGGRTEWGCWQRFNIVEFGTYRALIHAADAHGPTHVWRIS